MQVKMDYNKSRRKILLVDDDPLLRELGKECIEHCGHNVTVAGNGNEAILATSKQDFDLIILDIKMPGIDGFETLKRLKNENKIKVLALTGYKTQDKNINFLEAGFSGIIHKPYTKEMLQTVITENLTTR